jgi:hypothetical protein
MNLLKWFLALEYTTLAQKQTEHVNFKPTLVRLLVELGVSKFTLHLCNVTLHLCSFTLDRCSLTLNLCSFKLHRCNVTLHRCSIK